jgi:hypothetical protein
MRSAVLAPLAAALVLGLAASGCAAKKDAASATAATPAPKCASSARAGWQRLANRVQAPVYCPAWLPDPLTAQINGPWGDIDSVDRRDRSYLIGFLWQERDSGEIHVNLRGYPGRATIPMCIDTYTAAGKTRNQRIPCFSDAQPRKRIGSLVVTPYRVNQGADQWHILYAWRRGHSLYTLSEHVAPPFSATQVVHNLDRMARNLQLIEPAKS